MKNTKTLSFEEIIESLKRIPKGKSLQAFNTEDGQSKVVATGTIYFTGTALDLNTRNGKLIKGDLKQEPGYTNLPTANKLPKGMHLLVTGIRILFDTVDNATLTNAAWKSEAPANFKNGEFTIEQKGDGTLFSSPVTDLTNFRASTGNDVDFRDVKPFLIRSETQFDPTVTLASPGVEDQLWRVELRVEIIQDSDKA